MIKIIKTIVKQLEIYLAGCISDDNTYEICVRIFWSIDIITRPAMNI